MFKGQANTDGKPYAEVVQKYCDEFNSGCEQEAKQLSDLEQIVVKLLPTLNDETQRLSKENLSVQGCISISSLPSTTNSSPEAVTSFTNSVKEQRRGKNGQYRNLPKCLG